MQSKGLHSHITLHKAGLHPSLATIGYPKVLYAGVGHHIKSCMVIVYACTSLICPQKGRVYIIQYVGTLHPHPYPHLHKEHTMHICMYTQQRQEVGVSSECIQLRVPHTAYIPEFVISLSPLDRLLPRTHSLLTHQPAQPCSLLHSKTEHPQSAIFHTKCTTDAHLYTNIHYKMHNTISKQRNI